MAELYEGEEIDFPIEFYQSKRFSFYIFTLLILGVIFFTYDFFFPIPTHRGELPRFIKLFVAIFCMGYSGLLLKAIYQNKPTFSLCRNKIVINTILKEPKTLYWKNIKAIHPNYGKRASVSFERVNAELFERQEIIPLQYLKFNNTTLNSREVENILRQVFDNAKNNTDKPVIYQKIKLKFWDWY